MRNELDRLKPIAKYRNHGLISYLSFEKNGFWPSQLIGMYDPKLTILELSCWNWWAGGKGKIYGIDCVTVGEAANKVEVMMDGAGTPFPLFSHFVCPKTEQHVIKWFRREVQ